MNSLGSNHEQTDIKTNKADYNILLLYKYIFTDSLFWYNEHFQIIIIYGIFFSNKFLSNPCLWRIGYKECTIQRKINNFNMKNKKKILSF